jgi:hypothetical protein
MLDAWRAMREGTLSPEEAATLQAQGAEMPATSRAAARRRRQQQRRRRRAAARGRAGRGGGRGDNNGGGQGREALRGIAANAGFISYPSGDLGDVVDRPGGTFSFAASTKAST